MLGTPLARRSLGGLYLLEIGCRCWILGRRGGCCLEWISVRALMPRHSVVDSAWPMDDRDAIIVISPELLTGLIIDRASREEGKAGSSTSVSAA
jgi:hypothetical protein